MKNSEIWVNVKNDYYKEFYEVSSFGNVRSVERYYISGNGSLKKTGCILKQGIDKDGYKLVRLSVNGKVKTFKVHRLVAEAFIPNPNNYPIINHKDENPSNNNVENLEWCTNEYNIKYGHCIEKMIKNREGIGNIKSVLQYTKDGQFVAEYKSVTDAAIKNNIAPTNISAVCLNKPHYKTAGGYVFKFKS